MTVLVTGGAGFIGSHLVAALALTEVRVRVAHRSESSMAPLAQRHPNVEHVIADITDQKSIRAALTGTNTIYHLAGFGSPGSPDSDDMEIIRVNVSGTYALLHEAVAANIDRFVFISSASVYGDTADSPKKETMPTAPKSVYAASKIAGEDLCRVFSAQQGLDARILRLFNVYGFGQECHMVVPRFVHLLSEGKPVTLYGDGGQTRDFIHITDVVRAIIRAGIVHRVEAPVLNIGSGIPTSIREIVDTLASLLNVSPDVALLPERQGEIRESVADITTARRFLGFGTSTSLRDGLAQTIAHTVHTMVPRT